MAPPRPPAPIPPASCPFVSKRPPENPENRLVLSKRRSVCPTDRLSCCPASARRQLLYKPTGPGLLLSTGVCKTKKGQKKRACVNHSPALFFRRLKNEKKLSRLLQGYLTKDLLQKKATNVTESLSFRDFFSAPGQRSPGGAGRTPPPKYAPRSWGGGGSPPQRG